jgi:hypothetical protein
MSRTSEALTALYLNVHQRKLGIIIIRLSISYSMIVRSQAHCPRGTLPGSSTVTPLYQYCRGDLGTAAQVLTPVFEKF